MDTPLLFISHKHADKEIATALSAWIKKFAGRKLDIFQSSSTDEKDKSVKLGSNINTSIKSALWHCDTLVLIYTSEDADWSYCMYECGLATVPESPDTKIIVFQCGSEAPAPFKDQLRVNVRSAADIKKFANELLKGTSYFPSLKGASLDPDMYEETVTDASAELFEKLSKVLPKDLPGAIEEWPAWPYLKIQLSLDELDAIKNATSSQRKEVGREALKQNAVIVNDGQDIASVFGLTDIKQMKFAEVFKQWKESFPNEDDTWFNSCCDQMVTASQKRLPAIDMASFRGVKDGTQYTPILSRVKKLSFANAIQFDLYLYNLNDPRAIPAIKKMIPVDKLFFKTIDPAHPELFNLRGLREELIQSGRNRMPFLNENKTPQYIIHKSMFDDFLVKNMLDKPDVAANTYTLKDLLENAEKKEIFQSFITVSRSTSLAEAKERMNAIPGCSDIFITSSGKADEPIDGWLSNIDL